MNKQEEQTPIDTPSLMLEYHGTYTCTHQMVHMYTCTMVWPYNIISQTTTNGTCTMGRTYICTYYHGTRVPWYTCMAYHGVHVPWYVPMDVYIQWYTMVGILCSIVMGISLRWRVPHFPVSCKAGPFRRRQSHIWWDASPNKQKTRSACVTDAYCHSRF